MEDKLNRMRCLVNQLNQASDVYYNGKKSCKAGYYAGLGLSSYTKGGDKRTYGAEYLQVHQRYRETSVPIAQMTGELGYSFNFLSDNSKTVLFYGQFAGQSCLNLAGKLAVPCLLDLLHAVPEDRTVCKFRRGVGRQHDLRMNNAAFPGVVVGHAVPFMCQLGSAAVSSCGNSRTACAALDNTDGDMTEIYGEHLLSVRG